MTHWSSSLRLPLVAAILLSGCARTSEDSRRLTIISPHRDEIREETARAFEIWFAERSQKNRDDAVAALDAYFRSESDADEANSEHAVDRLLADWNADDVPELWKIRQRSIHEPGLHSAHALADAVRDWQPPPVHIAWQDIGGGTSQIAKYVQSGLQATPDGIGIDLLFGGGTDIYLQLARQELLQPVEVSPAILGRIPADLNGVPLYDPSPKHRWFGPMLSSFGILSNATVLERIGEPVPESWRDLGRPGLRGWVGAGDPRMTGSVHMVYEIILQSHGWDDGMGLLLRLGANTHQFIRDSGTLTRDVVLGEVSTAGAIDVNALSAVRLNPDIMRFTLPAGETIINPDAVAVLKGAPRPGLARAFVEFTLSEPGQRLFCLQPGQPGGPQRYPLCRLSVLPSLYQDFAPEARSTGLTNPFEVTNTIRYDSHRGDRRWGSLSDLFGAWVVDAHPDLREAWRAVCELPPSDPKRAQLERELFEPPCTEGELDAYAAVLAEGNRRVRTETVTRWGEEARQRYRRIRRETTR